jgi:hypothetical protein
MTAFNKNSKMQNDKENQEVIGIMQAAELVFKLKEDLESIRKEFESLKALILLYSTDVKKLREEATIAFKQTGYDFEKLSKTVSSRVIL